MARSSTISSAGLEITVKPNVALWKAELTDDGLKAAVSELGLRFLGSSFKHKTFPRAEGFRMCGVALSGLPSKMTMTDAGFDDFLYKKASNKEDFSVRLAWRAQYRSG